MVDEVHRQLSAALGRASATRLAYVRRAYRMLPAIDRPRILDIGCGRGEPTLELARLSGGEVIGLDIDQAALDALAERIAAEGLSDRVSVVNRSMRDLGLPDAVL